MVNSQFVASVHSDYLPFADLATNEELGQFVRAQMSYSRGEEIPELEGIPKALFDTHMALMARFEETSLKKREAGKKGGNPALNHNDGEVKQSLTTAKPEDKPISVSISESFTETDTMENQNTCAQEPRASVAEHDIPQAENSPATGDGAREQQHGGSGNDYTAEFEAFWEAYPRRVRKPDAFKAWRTRKKAGLPVSEVVIAAQTYAKAMAYLARPPDKIMHPQTFINADRWRGWFPPDGQEYLDARKSAAAMSRSCGIRHGPDAYEQAKATTPTEILGSIFGAGSGLARGGVVDVGQESNIDTK